MQLAAGTAALEAAMSDNDHIDPDSAAGNMEDSLVEQRADIERIKDYCQKLGEGISNAADLLIEMREQLAAMDIRLRKLEASKNG
jgi:hypothetical protein